MLKKTPFLIDEHVTVHYLAKRYYGKRFTYSIYRYHDGSYSEPIPNEYKWAMAS